MKHLTLTATLLIFLLPPAALSAPFCNANLPQQKPDSIYVDNGDGTITDTTTELMWQKCSKGTGGVDCLETAPVTPKTTFTWEEALAAAQSANAGTAPLLGFSDWRLPSVAELRTLAGVVCARPAINLNFFPATAPEVYWSASPAAYDDSYAWGVSFYGGTLSADDKDNDYHVRLVRGGQ